MRYYISKPKTRDVDESLIAGIKETDQKAVFAETLQDADICVLQKGWTRSKLCVAEYRLAKEKNIVIREGSSFTDRCSIKIN